MAVVDTLKEVVDPLIAAALIKQGTYALNLFWLPKRVFIAPDPELPHHPKLFKGGSAAAELPLLHPRE